MSFDFHEAFSRWAEHQRSLALYNAWLPEREGELGKVKAEHAKALEDFARRHEAESFDHATAIRQKTVVLKETWHHEKEEVRCLKEIFDRK